jgi:GLPGLI family protein
MKKILLPLLLVTCTLTQAQQYINSGLIEYEVRVNNHKMYEGDLFADVIKQRVPQFSITYYNFVFNQDKAIYKFDRFDPKTRVPNLASTTAEDNIWYSDYAGGTFTNQKFVLDNTYLLSGELMKIDWKLTPNETREIAGFNCRKATGIIFDSVYVFAFYTEEITISGGPMNIQGLPGMILGITIPRMNTSWIATRLQVNGVDTKSIAIPQKGRKKDALELKTEVEKVMKDRGKWGQQAVWGTFL